MKTSKPILFLLAAGIAGVAFPGTPPAPGAPADVDPLDVIAARENLMLAIEERMEPIDTYTVDPSVDTDLMRENAETISVMLQALPHLFPANSDLYDPNVETPVTLALPAIWKNFSNFYELGATAMAAADSLAGTGDNPDLLKARSLGLRATCDACHANYLLPYEEPTVSSEDLDFDFDSVFDKDQ